MFQVTFIFFLWNLEKSFDWGEGSAWVKMYRFNAFSRNLDTIIFKFFPFHGGICKFEIKCNKLSGERIKPYVVYRYMKGCILEVISEGWVCLLTLYLPFCWSWPRVWHNLKKNKKGSRERRRWNRALRFVCTLTLDFNKTSCTACLLLYCLFR